MAFIYFKCADNLSFQAKKQVNYVESDSEGEDDDEKIFRPSRNSRSKRRKMSPESDDEFKDGGDVGYSDDGQFPFPHHYMLF